jgi:NAD(P)-dependent dehydrogenase (short-subunit alcohol dehydrogenase family)
VATWLVTGSNRGIGLELCRQAHARGDTVIAACRTSSLELAAVGCRVVDGIDVAQPDVGETLLDAIGADVEVDVVVNNAGILVHDTVDRLDFEAAGREFEVNTLGALRVTTALLPRLGRGAKIAFVSSKAGSIGDRPSGGMYGYRMSKAALNMAAANLAREIAPRGVLVVVLHPGFVATDMTGGVGTVHPAAAATGLIARIDELDASRSGRFVHADGSEIPW